MVFDCQMSYLNAEKHRAHLSEPLRVNSCDALHVLLASIHQFMVHNVVWGVTQAIQSTAGVQKAGHAAAAVVVLSNPLQFGCIVEVCAADSLAHNIPVRS